MCNLKNLRLTSLLLGLMIAIMPLSLKAQKLGFRVCVDESDTPPLLTSEFPSSKSKQAAGLLIDLMDLALRNLNLSLEVVRYPWQRCIAKFKSGDIDAIVGLVWQKEYEKWAVFPMMAGHPDENYRLWQANYSIFVAPDSQVQWDGFNFAGLEKGASTVQGAFIEKSLKQMQAFSNQSYSATDGLRLVSLNHLDAYVMESIKGRSLIKEYALEGKLTELALPFAHTNWFVPVSSKWAARNPELTQAFWQALKRARIERGAELLRSYVSPYAGLAPPLAQ